MHTHRLTRIGLALAPLLLATALYGYSLRLPLFLDDGLLYLMIRDYGPEGVAPLRFWGGSATYHYYRPLGFTILELDYGADTRLDPFTLHTFNLLTFVFATAAVSALAARLGRSRWVGLIAGCAFALYPFSFRAVTWVAALFHVMVADYMAAALVCALRWLDTRSTLSNAGEVRRGPLVDLLLAWGFAFAALFSAESAVLLPPLIVLALWAAYGWGVFRWRRAWLLMGPILALTTVFAYLFLALPRPAAGPLTLRWESLPASLAVIGQGLVYPLATIVRRLTLADAQTLPLLALIAGGMALGLWLSGRSWRGALVGLAWFAWAALPPALLLPTDYVKGSVHVMHLAAVGAALFWGNALAAQAQRGAGAKQRRSGVKMLRWGVVAVLIGGGVVVSGAYLTARRAEALRQSDYLWRLMALVEADPSGTAVINAPAFLSAYDRDRLLLTTSEATMFAEGSYTNHADQLRAMWGREVPGIAGFLHPPGILPPSAYTFAPYWTETPADLPTRLRDFRQIIATYFEGDHFYPAYVGGAGLPGPDAPIARFPAVGLSLTVLQVAVADQAVTVESRWAADGPVAAIPLYQVWCGDALIGESRHGAWGGALPFEVWRPGEIQTDSRPIHPPYPFTADCVRVSVSLLTDGGLVEGVDASGAPLTEGRAWAADEQFR
jgi:hypothetical protein